MFYGACGCDEDADILSPSAAGQTDIVGSNSVQEVWAAGCVSGFSMDTRKSATAPWKRIMRYLIGLGGFAFLWCEVRKTGDREGGEILWDGRVG
jgi:hypothetical protein